jgi:hypothetical protein
VTIKWWENEIDFVKIKSHLNENIKWHCMQLELNWNSIQVHGMESKILLSLDAIHFNSFQISKVDWVQIGLKLNFNSIQSLKNQNTKLIHKLLKICLPFPSYATMVLKNKTTKKHDLKKTPFHSIHNKFQIKIYFVKMRWLLKPKPIYPKLAPLFALSL